MLQPTDGYLSGYGHGDRVRQLDDTQANQCDTEQTAMIDIDHHARSTRVYVGEQLGFDNYSADFFFYYYSIIALATYSITSSCRSSTSPKAIVATTTWSSMVPLFALGTASSFVALYRVAGVPARIAFQTLPSRIRSFFSPEIGAIWGSRSGR
ncbi:hypothetical protein [Mycobacterium lepromatosis]|uniref:hypothetical protein n=1 Tax=Mycobacterium lepromatosis TaxID=480418 RepID=UPI0015859C8D